MYNPWLLMMLRSDEVRMLLHGLPQRLMECTRALRLGADFDIRTAQPPGGRALQRYLLHAVWDTGQGPPRVDGGEDDDGEQGDGQVGRAVKALRVISAVYTTDSWVGGSTDDDSPNNPWKKYEVKKCCCSENNIIYVVVCLNRLVKEAI